MIEETLPDAEAAASSAASFIAQQARSAVRAHGRFLLALSGGSTARGLLTRLADQDVPWDDVHLFQVDERIVAESDPARNLTDLTERLLDEVPLPPTQVHALPVDDGDLPRAVARFGKKLHEVAGSPPLLDLVQLGLGEDGHTASLVPGDPVLEATSDVAVTGPYRGHRRMTLTYPVLNSARVVLWVVTGAAKASAVKRLREGDPTIPAGKVNRDHAVLIVDAAAGSGP